jgi:hypothetical protein
MNKPPDTSSRFRLHHMVIAVVAVLVAVAMALNYYIW